MRRAMYGSFEESMLHVMAHLPVVVVVFGVYKRIYSKFRKSNQNYHSNKTKY